VEVDANKSADVKDPKESLATTKVDEKGDELSINSVEPVEKIPGTREKKAEI
jgi:hypothetical protein